MAGTKERLDRVLQALRPDLSRNQIASFIMQGLVTVDGRPVTKPGQLVSPDVPIVCTYTEPQYVGRAGFKLAGALDAFTIDVTGTVCLDAGLSTGGFTDCLLQRGATKVFGVDVGYGQVHEKIRTDARVVVLERTNLRELKHLPGNQLVDLVTLDLSFISVLKVMPAVVNLMKPDARLVILIKPQFEAERGDIGRGGIVRDPVVHERVVQTIRTGLATFGFSCVGVIESPITGTDGNKEFLGYFVRNHPQ